MTTGPNQSAKPADDDRTTPPVADDSGPLALDYDEQPSTLPGDAPVDPPAPAMSPFDQNRSKIADRFSKKRTEEPEPVDMLSGDNAPDLKQPPIEQNEPDDALELKVDGKPLKKTVDEIAVLADLSPEEVRADPKRAIKYAQRELATTQRLEKSKTILREASDRALRTDPDDETARPRSSAPHQEPKPGPKKDAARSDDAESLDVDFEKLAESIQVDDPKQVAPKLKEVFERMGQAAQQTARAALSEAEVTTRHTEDQRLIQTGMQEFIDDHKEIAGNKFIASATAAALIEEYRDDLAKCPDVDPDILAQATPDQIAAAHQHRRINGDPNVRKVDKSMLKSAYGRVTESLGITTPPQQQNLTNQRQERKVNLQPQPRRASMPPATTPAPKAPPSRGSIVAEMAAGRGQKRPTAS